MRLKRNHLFLAFRPTALGGLPGTGRHPKMDSGARMRIGKILMLGGENLPSANCAPGKQKCRSDDGLALR